MTRFGRLPIVEKHFSVDEREDQADKSVSGVRIKRMEKSG